jgi:hypothetical protein
MVKRSIFGPDARWPAELAVVAAIVLYVVLPNRLIVGPRWLLPVLEVLLIIPLAISRRVGPREADPIWRALSITVIALINLANIISVALLVDRVLHNQPAKGTQLMYSGIAIWVTNFIVFGLWFWELDRGGPTARSIGQEREPDFLFPEMIYSDLGPRNWQPGFFDYLYTGFTNATAFSPTVATPVSISAKWLMMLESSVSLVTVLVILSRAVGIIG